MLKLKLIGPFSQLLTMDKLPARGPIADNQLEVIEQAGILLHGETIEAIGRFSELESLTDEIEKVEGNFTLIPGLIDVHTHICWAGTRAGDYAMRLSGKDYLEISRQGGGIWSTVTQTRAALPHVLKELTVKRAEKLLEQGVTTIEVKSGYGLETRAELKILDAVFEADRLSSADLIPTCLAAHIKPKDFSGSAQKYLEHVVKEMLPLVLARQLSSRVDIYIDEGAFTVEEGRYYLNAAKSMGFDCVVHADQFYPGGLELAVEFGALSADHLESAAEKDIHMISKSDVIPVALPGASLGLGVRFTPARKLLDAGCSLVVASDWNPGTAPMGKMMMQASILGAYEKLTMAETLAAITCRAAPALRLNDRGILKQGMLADIIAFPCSDYREIIYNQGGMMPEMVWKRGKKVGSGE